MSTEQFDAVIVGAGFGGMGAAIQLNQLGYRNIAILDREDDLGGTWHVNRYPGLTVDVPSTTYSYWFEPNPYWSRLYAPGSELKTYAEHVADKYDLRRYMRFNTVVDGARWDDEAQEWVVSLTGGQTLRSQFLVLATGYLCQPKKPDIPGIDTFAGTVLHAQEWDDDYSLRGKRAAIIGTGSTGVQLIPKLAEDVADLTVYQRTPIWVMPKFDLSFGPRTQRIFAKFPATQRFVRLSSDMFMDIMTTLAMWKFRQLRPINTAAAKIGALHRFLAIRDKDLRRKLTPDYDFGCKRPTLSNVYYRTFTKPHVHLETGGIDHIEPDGIVGRDGTKRVIDTLVLATGFDVWESNLPAIEVIGRDGRDLGKWWRENRFQAYEGMTVPQFPNLVTQASPYAWVGMSWFDTVEYQMRHMKRLFGELQRRGGRTFEVTEEANARFLERMLTLLDDSVFRLGDCTNSRSYWFNSSGEAPLFRPTSIRQAVKEQERFPLSDYAIA
ncbi:flavin-containing monooxygenase [Mycobacterium sp. 4D054]|uniref:flavin-containing monooxygenase n=1 Tax=unclassified Mycobacterium TaxID=2642494 RepID=UPI0021B24D10|nr:NAD(P)/FAD-dependent oxidoreductase [Mycobacterium sp. SMC-8]UXA10886.1 NAD(P)/FAD-dependent oxidoreductase [Mycobacterium sp. SMC-8]